MQETSKIAFDGQCAFALSTGKYGVQGHKDLSLAHGGTMYHFSNPVAKFLWRVLPGRREAAEKTWVNHSAADGAHPAPVRGKSLTCKDVGGACDETFTATSFEEIGQMCRTHVMAHMDDAHKAKMEEMRALSPDEQQSRWMEWKKKFDEAPDA